jgi:hypothetical protein
MNHNLRAILWIATMAYFGFLFAGRGVPSFNAVYDFRRRNRSRSRIAPLDNVCPPSQAQKDLSDFGPPGRPLVSCPSEY